MKPIKTVGVIGLGALGVLYADQFTRALGKAQVLVLADQERIGQYRRDGVWYNGQLCDFNYTVASQAAGPVDLLVFSVKFRGLDSAIAACRRLVGPDTILLSVLNGISSEEILGQAFGAEKVVWCVAQKMSARKEGNRAFCSPTGELAIGAPSEREAPALGRLIAFFDRIGFAYTVPQDIRSHMWGKLMCNTGCNQSSLVFRCSYGGLQAPGPARDAMIGAMGEVAEIARAEGIPLYQRDIDAWVDIIDHFPPQGESSMRQDGKNCRPSEVELFAGTIRRLGKKHGIPTPVNDWLYDQIKRMEAAY